MRKPNKKRRQNQAISSLLLGSASAFAWLPAACSGGDPNESNPAPQEVATVDELSADPANAPVATDTQSLIMDDLTSSPMNTTASPRPGRGCTKVDFLFVVDNSFSMLEEQQALIRSFPGFVNVVEQKLGSNDFHVMVVDTDALSVGDAVTDVLDLFGSGSAAGDKSMCRSVIGAGRRVNQDGRDCGLPDQRRYMDAKQSGLDAAFACAAEVGVAGDGQERPIAALLSSLEPSINAPGGCNEGFLRDDAVLVVTVIGDEDDVSSEGDPESWRDALISYKGGSDQSVVFLGLIATEADQVCNDNTNPALRLTQLAESFGFGSTGSICASDFAPFFQDAVSVIDTACNIFVPTVR